MAVSLANFAVPVVDEYLAILIFCDFSCGFNRLLLRRMVRSVALRAFPLYRPTIFSFDYMLICHVSFHCCCLCWLYVRVAFASQVPTCQRADNCTERPCYGKSSYAATHRAEKGVLVFRLLALFN